MTFPKTPHELSRIAARFMLGFLLLPFVLSFLQYLLFIVGWRFWPVADASASDQVATFWLGWAFSTMISPVFTAFGYTLLAWLIASVGVLVASRGPVLAALIFAFAALAASPGLGNEYWYVTLPSVIVLVWLAVASWKLRNYVHRVELNPGDAAAVHHQHHALEQRDISTQEIIARR